jgi:NIPSNAP
VITLLAAASACCAVLELRQYTLRPRQREILIELFDREFVEAQEALGIRSVGQFRDLDAPDRFVWLRGFPDMAARKHGLTALYTGPAWKAHGKRAAATMLDASNVLLLRPVDPAEGFDALPPKHPAIGTRASPPSIVTATVYLLRPSAALDFPAFFRERIRPALAKAGIEPLATFESEHAANDYPALPVREGEHAFVWFARGDDTGWAVVNPLLADHLAAPPQHLRLRPTARSLLR